MSIALTTLFADLIVWGGGGIASMLIQLLILVAVVAIVYIFLVNVLKWTPPDWAVNIFWIVIGLVFVIWAIRIVMSL